MTPKTADSSELVHGGLSTAVCPRHLPTAERDRRTVRRQLRLARMPIGQRGPRRSNVTAITADLTRLRLSDQPSPPGRIHITTCHRHRCWKSITIGEVSNAPAAFTLPVAAVLLILAVLALITAIRGWTGALRRDSKLGVHSIAASSSDDAFALANKVAAPVVGGAAAMSLVLAVLVLILPLPTPAIVIIGVLSIVAVVVLLVAGGILGEKAARTLPVPLRMPKPSAACDGCACGAGGCGGLTRNAAPVDAETI